MLKTCKNENLIGRKFDRWTVIAKAEKRNGMSVWKCRCECGTEKEVYQKHLLSGATKSCGCLAKEKSSKRMKQNNPTVRKHKMCYTRLYNVWSGIKQRCQNPHNTKYQNYGGRGIKICEEWQDFGNFMQWALNNGYDETLTIDRINYDGDYEPCNCRFITIQEQQFNKSTNHLITYNGRTQTLTEWANERGIKRNTLDARINRSHWDIGRALNYG